MDHAWTRTVGRADLPATAIGVGLAALGRPGSRPKSSADTEVAPCTGPRCPALAYDLRAWELFLLCHAQGRWVAERKGYDCRPRILEDPNERPAPLDGSRARRARTPRPPCPARLRLG